MKLNELNIHDTQILRVIEDTQSDILDFEIDYPVDYEKGIYEKKTLRFVDFLNYQINEIPFSGLVTILQIENLKRINYSIGSGKSKMEITRNQVEFVTNAGTRKLEFKSFELI